VYLDCNELKKHKFIFKIKLFRGKKKKRKNNINTKQIVGIVSNRQVDDGHKKNNILKKVI
jgi:hypothetical protein